MASSTCFEGIYSRDQASTIIVYTLIGYISGGDVLHSLPRALCHFLLASVEHAFEPPGNLELRVSSRQRDLHDTHLPRAPEPFFSRRRVLRSDRWNNRRVLREVQITLAVIIAHPTSNFQIEEHFRVAALGEPALAVVTVRAVDAHHDVRVVVSAPAHCYLSFMRVFVTSS